MVEYRHLLVRAFDDELGAALQELTGCPEGAASVLQSARGGWVDWSSDTRDPPRGSWPRSRSPRSGRADNDACGGGVLADEAATNSAVISSQSSTPRTSPTLGTLTTSSSSLNPMGNTSPATTGVSQFEVALAGHTSNDGGPSVVSSFPLPSVPTAGTSMTPLPTSLTPSSTSPAAGARATPGMLSTKPAT